MAHHTEQAGFPNIPLNAGMKLRIRALSPTTDAEVAGVTSTQWSIYGRDKSIGVEGLLSDTVPGWIPGEVEGTGG